VKAVSWVVGSCCAHAWGVNVGVLQVHRNSGQVGALHTLCQTMRDGSLRALILGVRTGSWCTLMVSFPWLPHCACHSSVSTICSHKPRLFHTCASDIPNKATGKADRMHSHELSNRACMSGSLAYLPLTLSSTMFP
jgi:hypothetical protein